MIDAPTSAFLLSQLGAYAAGRFAESVAELDLTPPQSGLLRLVAAQPGLSQQELARRLGMAPSRLVALVDGLDERELVERRRNPDDRRLHALYVTDAGAETLARIGEVGRAHDDAVTGGLSAADRARLHRILTTLADQHGLTPGVHPGFTRV